MYPRPVTALAGAAASVPVHRTRHTQNHHELPSLPHPGSAVQDTEPHLSGALVSRSQHPNSQEKAEGAFSCWKHSCTFTLPEESSRTMDLLCLGRAGQHRWREPPTAPRQLPTMLWAQKAWKGPRGKMAPPSTHGPRLLPNKLLSDTRQKTASSHATASLLPWAPTQQGRLQGPGSARMSNRLCRTQPMKVSRFRKTFSSSILSPQSTPVHTCPLKYSLFFFSSSLRRLMTRRRLTRKRSALNPEPNMIKTSCGRRGQGHWNQELEGHHSPF